MVAAVLLGWWLRKLRRDKVLLGPVKLLPWTLAPSCRPRSVVKLAATVTVRATSTTSREINPSAHVLGPPPCSAGLAIRASGAPPAISSARPTCSGARARAIVLRALVPAAEVSENVSSSVLRSPTVKLCEENKTQSTSGHVMRRDRDWRGRGSRSGLASGVTTRIG